MEPSAAPRHPLFRRIAEHSLLVEFGDRIDESIHAQVLQLDAALAQAPFAGFLEAIPAYAALLVRFDALVTDHAKAEAAVLQSGKQNTAVQQPSSLREVLVCYEDGFAPDLAAVAEASGLSTEAVIAAHLSGDYKVYMYGFAPGYAYLAGVPKPIQHPRKASPVRGIPAGSVLIAGPQCLVSTLTMPTGWWIIGRSPTPILIDDPAHPFLFNVGDRVRFRRISRAEHDAGSRR